MRKNNSGFLIASIFLMLFAFLFVVSNYSEWAEGDSVFFNLPITGFLIEKSLDNSSNTNTIYENNFTHLNISDNDLVLYMPFDYNHTSGIIYDYSSNGNDGVVTNVVYDTSGCVFGGCYSFDGTDDRITIPDNESLQEFSAFTYSCWLKSETFSTVDRYFVLKDFPNFYMKAVTGTRIYIRHDQIGDGSSDFNPISENLNDKAWHHVVFVWNGSNTHLYVDGNHYTGEAATGTMDLTGANLYIGYGSSLGDDWLGLIDEIGIWNRTLSPTEIAQIYNATYSRFYPVGEMKFENLNFGTNNNTLNISIADCQTVNGSKLYGKINDGDYEEFSNCAITNYSMLGDLTNANLTIKLNSTPYNFYSPLVIGNVSLDSYTAGGGDTTPPTYSLNQTNSTLAGQSTKFSLYVNDETALETNGQYIFSTNNTGVWANDSAINFTSTPQWANITKNLNSTSGISVGYRWYLTDNAGNSNHTGIYVLTTNSKITFIQYDDYYETGYVSSISNDIALSTTTGNFIAVVIGGRYGTSGSAEVTDVTDTAGNTYVKAIGAWRTAPTVERSEIWYAENIIGNANNVVTVSFTGSCDSRFISVSEYSGVATSDSLLDTSSQYTTAQTSHSSGVATSTSTGDLIIGGYNADGSRDMTIGAGFIALSSDLTYVSRCAEYDILGAAGDYDADFTSSTSTHAIVTAAIFRVFEDTTPPTYSLNQTNSTLAGQSTKFSLYVNDETALETNGQYIFSTNNTGVWANDSAVNFTATPSWANITKTLNSTLGISVGYRWYLTDNAGNENVTEIFVLTTTDGTPPTITFESPTPDNGSTVTETTQTITANISDDSNGNTSSWIDFDNSLLGYWAMDYYNSTGIFDNSSNDNFGSFNGGLSSSDIVSGVRGDALEFNQDGGDDSISNNNSDFDFNLDGEVSFFLWFNTGTVCDNPWNDSGDNNEVMASRYGTYHNNKTWWFGCEYVSSKLLFHMIEPSFSIVLTSPEIVNDDSWHHAGWSYDGNSETAYLYMDGQLVNSTSTSGFTKDFYSNNPLCIGAYDEDCNTYEYQGYLDEVMIFNRSLSASEVLALYDSRANKFNATFTELSEGQHNYSVYAIDSSGNLNISDEQNFIVGEDTTPPTITFESPTPTNGSTVPETTQTITANISDDSNGNTSSWIDFDNSLLGYWAMDYYNSTGIFDNSSNDNFGVFEGGLSLTNISNGIHGNGLDFDGVDDSVNVGEDFNFSGTNHFTISSWINTNGYKTSSILSRYNTSVGGAREVSFYMLDSNITLLRECDTFNLYTNYVPPLGEWVNVVFRFDGSYMALYVNGEFYQQKLLDCSVPSVSSDVLIGSLQTGADYTYSFNGSIDEVMVFNRNLSADEISALYNSKINKFNATFTGLSNGQHNYSVYAIDSSGNLNISDERNFIVGNYTPSERKFISIGDSITVGYGLDNPNNEVWGNLTAQNLSLGWINIAQGGAEIENDILNFISNASGYNSSSIIVVMGGTNDLTINHTSHESFLTAYKSVVQSLLDYGYNQTNIYLSAVPWANDTTHQPYIPEFNDLINETAQNKSVNFVYITPYLEDHNEYLQSDGLHPNVEGNEEIAHVISYYILNGELPPDTIPPTYSLNQTNSTIAGESVKFSLYVNDDFALETSGQYIFSTNNTGVWTNDSAINFTSTPQWANITKNLNSTSGISVGYRWYLTDNAGNSNHTGIYVLNTTDDITAPFISFISPTQPNGTTITDLFTGINASIIESALGSVIFNWNGTNATLYDNSVVAKFNMNNNSYIGENATTIKDESIYGNNGTCTNCPTLVDGITGKAYSFDGVNDEMIIPDSASLDILDNVTISTWVKVGSFSDSGFITKRSGADNTYILGNLATGTLFLFIDTTSGDAYAESSVLQANTWYHVVGTYNGSLISLYINGVLNDTTAQTGSMLNVATDLYLGAQPDHAGGYVNATIDDVILMNKSVTATDVKELYYSNLNKQNTTDWNLFINQSGLQNGTYTYQAFATDNLGNLNQTDFRTLYVNTSYVLSDTTLPTISSINSPLNKSYTTTNNILFNITATDDVEVSACVYSFNEGTTNYTLSNSGGDYWTTTRSSMSNGLYGVRFYCVDSSDNWNFSSRLYFTVNYDSGDTSPGGGSPSLTTTTTLPDISVSPSTINLDVGLYTTKVAFILVTNEGDDILNLSITENNLGKRVILPSDYEVVVPGETKALEFIFVGLNDTGVYTGTISIGGKAIPVSLNIKELNLLFDSNIVVLNKAYIVRQGDKLKTSVELIPMGDPARLDVTLNYAIKDYEDNIYLTRSETVLVEDRMKFNRDFDTGILPVGKYVVALELIYPNGVAPSSAHFEIIEWIPTTFFGRLVFYIVNAILIILIVIISIIIRNLVVRIKRNKK